MQPDPAQIAGLAGILAAGTPREAWQAGQALRGFGAAAEAPVIAVLLETQDALRLRDILTALQGIKVSQPEAVEAVLRQLAHKDKSVRGAAAQCLLLSSPKLRQHLGRIQSLAKREADAGVRAILQKLLDRYPNQA